MSSQLHHASSTPQGDESEHGPWSFNARAGLITHEIHACTTCSAWNSHYMLAVMNRSTSLDRAEHKRDTFIHGPLTLEIAAMRDTNEAFRQQCQAGFSTNVLLNKELDDMRGRLSEANETIQKRNRELDNVDRDLRDERKTVDELNDEIKRLRAQIVDLERGHGPRQRKVPRRRSRSESPIGSRGGSRATSSRPFTPASAIDADGDTAAPRPHLLSRLADRSAAASSSSSLVIEPPRPPSTEPQRGVDLASRLSDHLPGALDLSVTAPDTPTPSSSFVESIGIHSLLPVVYFPRGHVLSTPPQSHHGSAATRPNGDSALLPDGTLDFTAHPRYVLAIYAHTSEGDPCWSTTLVSRDFFTSLPVQRSMAARAPLPLHGTIGGGRDGVLTSPYLDPTTDEALDALFANPGGRSYGFIERIRYTPPEIRTDLHRRALRLWKEMDPELRRHRDIKRTEPSPRADTKVWKKWLKAMYEADTSFEYIGVPRVGEGYISAHIEGARTTSDFIPTNAKGQPNRGSLRDTILRAAAGVLIVPQRYTRNLNRLKLQIAEIRRTQQYDASRFGDENHLGIHEMVEYLASIGVTEDEAESLRPWAAAFIEMDLEKHPHSHHANNL